MPRLSTAGTFRKGGVSAPYAILKSPIAGVPPFLLNIPYLLSLTAARFQICRRQLPPSHNFTDIANFAYATSRCGKFTLMTCLPLGGINCVRASNSYGGGHIRKWLFLCPHGGSVTDTIPERERSPQSVLFEAPAASGLLVSLQRIREMKSLIQSQVLTFSEKPLALYTHNERQYFVAADIANALGYAREDSVTRIYVRNKKEFREDMTETVKLTVTGNIQKTARLFSLRGTHLIAMKATTPIAEDFRAWVLDVLEGLAEPVTPRHDLATRKVSDLVGHLDAETMRGIVSQEIAKQLAAIPAMLSQALVYKTGEHQGETKEVATSKQVGRVMQLLRDLEKKIDALKVTNPEREDMLVLATMLVQETQAHQDLQRRYAALLKDPTPVADAIALLQRIGAA